MSAFAAGWMIVKTRLLGDARRAGLSRNTAAGGPHKRHQMHASIRHLNSTALKPLTSHTTTFLLQPRVKSNGFSSCMDIPEAESYLIRGARLLPELYKARASRHFFPSSIILGASSNGSSSSLPPCWLLSNTEPVGSRL